MHHARRLLWYTVDPLHSVLALVFVIIGSLNFITLKTLKDYLFHLIQGNLPPKEVSQWASDHPCRTWQSWGKNPKSSYPKKSGHRSQKTSAHLALGFISPVPKLPVFHQIPLSHHRHTSSSPGHQTVFLSSTTSLCGSISMSRLLLSHLAISLFIPVFPLSNTAPTKTTGMLYFKPFLVVQTNLPTRPKLVTMTTSQESCSLHLGLMKSFPPHAACEYHTLKRGSFFLNRAGKCSRHKAKQTVMFASWAGKVAEFIHTTDK